MTTLFLLAGRQQEADLWIREHKASLTGLSIRYVSSKSLAYCGFKDCYYLKIGTWQQAGYPQTLFDYFKSHQIYEVSEEAAALKDFGQALANG